MADTAFVNDARVISKGQVTIPKNVRTALGIFVIKYNAKRLLQIISNQKPAGTIA